jgi:hypothetical protein
LTVTALRAAAKLADAYNLKRKARLALQKQVTDLEEEEKELKGDLIAALASEKATAVGGSTCTIEMKTVMEPTVADWKKLQEHIRATGNFELLYQRVNGKAVKERWDNKEEVPGVQRFPVTKLSISQIKE